MDNQEKPARANLSTPVLVGSMAAGILAVAFLVAIIRGGGGEPPTPGAALPAREAAPAGPADGADVAADRVLPLSPRDMAAREGLTFTWRAGESIREARVTVYDTLMKPVWVSPRVQDHSVQPPEKIMEHLKAGPSYRWKVTGYTAGGSESDSASVPFRLVEPVPGS